MIWCFSLDQVLPSCVILKASVQCLYICTRIFPFTSAEHLMGRQHMPHYVHFSGGENIYQATVWPKSMILKCCINTCSSQLTDSRVFPLMRVCLGGALSRTHRSDVCLGGKGTKVWGEGDRECECLVSYSIQALSCCPAQPSLSPRGCHPLRIMSKRSHPFAPKACPGTPK